MLLTPFSIVSLTVSYDHTVLCSKWTRSFSLYHIIWKYQKRNEAFHRPSRFFVIKVLRTSITSKLIRQSVSNTYFDGTNFKTWYIGLRFTTCPRVEGCAKFASPLHTTKDIISCHATTAVTFNCQLHSNYAIQLCSLHLHCSLWSIQELYHCWHLCALLVFCAKRKFCGQLLGKHPAGRLKRWDFYVIQILGMYAVRMVANW